MLAACVAAIAAISLGSAEAAAKSPPQVTVALLPRDVGVERLGRVEGIAPGLLSAGIGGDVGAAQTYLDISQGARTFEHLYDGELPRIIPGRRGVSPAAWERVLERADSPPAELEPGLLAGTLTDQGIPAQASLDAGLGALIAVQPDGAIPRPRAGQCSARGCGPGLTVLRASLPRLRQLIAEARGDDVVVAMREAPPPEHEQLPLGIAGRGFEGNLTSGSTRTEGLVLTSDLARTLVERLGVEPPGAMAGQPITAEGEADAEQLVRLEERLAERPARGAVVGMPIGAWLLLTAASAALFGARGARVALPLLAVSGVYLPAMLLVGAALQPAEAVEALIVGVGAPLLAALTLAVFRGYGALAFACGVTVCAYAVDVLAGSPLTALSVLGPNPGLGVRFYGIGNELEAALASMVLIGTGAVLGSRAVSPRAAALTFAATAILAAAVFAPGRFGADVGAAIVLGAGGATAISLMLGLGWRGTLALLVFAGIGGLGALALADLILGGDAHLTRSVLEAQGAGDLAELVERRLRLTARSFVNPAYPVLLTITAVLIVLGVHQRRRILSWLGDGEAARAGYVGAAVAGVVGTLANDSGAILLIIATIYLAVCAGFFWARRPEGTEAVGEQGIPSAPTSPRPA